MPILNAIMVPHPPLIIPRVGRGQEKKIQATIDACREAAALVANAKPDTVVVITPHSTLYADWFHISHGEGASGSFARFGAADVRITVRYDTLFAETLSRRARERHIRAGTQGEKGGELDHAAMIPLIFLREALGQARMPDIVRVGLSGLPLTEHYRLGMLIRDTAEGLGRRVSLIASGDLSHRLLQEGPYGFSPEGPEYDRRIMDVMGRGAFDELFDFSPAFLEGAGECGHRSFTIMAGCLDGQAVSARSLSYEGPFGVGYGVCVYTPGDGDEKRHYPEGMVREKEEDMMAHGAGEDAHVRLARLCVESFVKTGRPARLPDDLPRELTGKRAAVFVTLHKGGCLRGCIGTINPARANVAEEILHNAVSACSQDPRFPPVRADELPELEYSVDVLGATEDIASPDELDVKRYGVIVTCNGRRGLLLPDLDGVDTPEQQIAIARQKAGISPRESVKLQRFEVIRHV